LSPSPKCRPEHSLEILKVRDNSRSKLTQEAHLLTKVLSTSVYNTTGYVAIDRTHSLIVVAFRGTEDCPNDTTGNCAVGIGSYSTTTPFPPQNCPGCAIGAGWLAAYNEVSNDIREEVRKANASHSTYRVLVTGHSLGGALATVAGIDLRSRGYTVDLVGFIHVEHFWNLVADHVL
jgi:hypothetical protein